MRIYISSAREDLPVARELAGLLTRHPDVASTGDTTIYNPLDDPALAGKSERDVQAACEAKLAESNFVALLLSPAALSSPYILRDIEQARRMYDASEVKFFLTVLLQPVTLDEFLASLPSVDATSRPIDAVADEVAYYTTWRPRQTGGAIYFAPPRPAPQAPPSPMLPPDPGAVSAGAPLPPPSPAPAAPPPFSTPPPPPAPQGAPAGAPPLPSPQQPGGKTITGAPPPSPRRERGGEFDAKRTASPSTSTLQFSAYHPNALAVETWHTLLVYTYIADALAQIQADAATFTELGSAPTVAKGQSTRAVERGVELTIEPHIEGVTFTPTSDSFVWRD
ncbi:MAG: toll/interleukin-1 receptor domain-containing protein, partial [Ktedonobacterales bacterium]